MVKLSNEELSISKDNTASQAGDLFEFVREKIGCAYISDLRLDANKNRVCNAMSKIDLSGYSIEVLEDMASYLYAGKHNFDTREQACEFFENRGIQG